MQRILSVALITNYEVYIFDKGEWSIYSRYPSSQRETAVNEAKDLEHQYNRPTKVVKERYDPKTNHGDEVVVYLSERIMRGSQYYPKSGNNRRSYGRGADSWLDNLSDKRSENSQKVISYTGLFLRISLLILVSLVIAGLVTYLLTALLNIFGRDWSPSLLFSLTFASFIIVFILTAVISSLTLIPWKNVDLSTTPKIYPIQPFFKSRYQKMAEYNPFDSFFSFFRYLFGSKGTPPPEAASEDVAPKEIEEAQAEEPEETESVSPDTEDTDAETETTPDKKKEAEALHKAAQVTEEAEARKVPPEKMHKIRGIIDDFVKQVLGIVKRYDIRMDIYTRVSVNLIVAGACERISTFFNLPLKEYKDTLGHAIKEVSAETFVSDETKNREFYEAFNNPALEGYHRELIVFGNRAMDTVLRKIKRDAFAGLGEHMQAWREIVTAKVKPLEEGQKKAKIMTLMFTDIVDSTEMGQKKGQDFVQHILHVHNSVIREALRLYHGLEVKHLGDGMFVRFASAYDGLKAAIYIQDRFHSHNLAYPEEEFFVRIGMNAGEPISEDGDLFGTVVQITSRVCEQALGGQILISEDLHALTIGDGFIFNDEGDFALKGIKDKQKLYSVIWQIEPPTDEEKEKNEEDELAATETVPEQEAGLEKDAEIAQGEEPPPRIEIKA